MSGGAIASVLCGRMLPDTQNGLRRLRLRRTHHRQETIWEARLGRAEMVSATQNRAETYEYDYLANFVDELEDFEKAVEEDREPGPPAGTGSRRPKSPKRPSSPPAPDVP